MDQSTPVEELKNLGPKCRDWLEPLKIRTRGDLDAWSFEDLYRAVRTRVPHCNAVFLYAVAGALLDIGWNEIPPDMKNKLLDIARSVDQEIKKKKR
ncbi:MAG: TfoX/Sxy family DNA transformation protein [Candidatus Peribacteraceae bacterium]